MKKNAHSFIQCTKFVGGRAGIDIDCFEIRKANTLNLWYNHKMYRHNFPDEMN